MTREELLSRANDIYGWINTGDLKVAVRTVSRSRFLSRGFSRFADVDETNLGRHRGHTCAHTNIKQSFEASQSIRGIASRVAFLFAARRRRSSRTTADPSRFSFPSRAAGGPLLPPGAGRGGPRLSRGGQVARQGSVRDLMNRVFVVTLVETATNAGIESASRAYQSDDDAVHTITTTIVLDTSQTNEGKRVNHFFLEKSNQSATRRGGRFRRLLFRTAFVPTRAGFAPQLMSPHLTLYRDAR